MGKAFVLDDVIFSFFIFDKFLVKHGFSGAAKFFAFTIEVVVEFFIYFIINGFIVYIFLIEQDGTFLVGNNRFKTCLAIIYFCPTEDLKDSMARVVIA